MVFESGIQGKVHPNNEVFKWVNWVLLQIIQKVSKVSQGMSAIDSH